MVSNWIGAILGEINRNKELMVFDWDEGCSVRREKQS